MIRSLLLLVFLVWPCSLLAQEKSSDGQKVLVSTAVKNEQGFLVHQVQSPCQSGQTQIRVLLPDKLESEKTYPVIYVLPVEAKAWSRYGDGLLEVQRQKLHQKHAAIFVAPTFSELPWYADNPANPQLRQESYFLRVVLPFVEQTYPVSNKADGRLLLGFSKSGWGAWALLLRHPDTFGRAAAWDAPLMMTKIGLYGNRDIFGTQENFDQYRPDLLLKSKPQKLIGKNRLILTGYGNFREHHQQAHKLLEELQMAHVYLDGPQLKHDWHSGWVSEAVEKLLAD